MPRGFRSEDFKVYVGGLRHGVNERDIERMFDRYGTINRIFVARKPPGFAFVHFDRIEDAEEAVRRCDGKEIRGHRIRVELSHGKRTSRKNRWSTARHHSRSSSRSRLRSRSPQRSISERSPAESRSYDSS